MLRRSFSDAAFASTVLQRPNLKHNLSHTDSVRLRLLLKIGLLLKLQDPAKRCLAPGTLEVWQGHTFYHDFGRNTGYGHHCTVVSVTRFLPKCDSQGPTFWGKLIECCACVANSF